MNWLINLYQKFFDIPLELEEEIHYETVINAMDPWFLACAVCAWNQTLGISAYKLGFKDWFRISKKNWLPEVKEKTGFTEGRIFRMLAKYVRENAFKDLRTVYDEEERKRGNVPDVILMPGEGMTMSVTLQKTRN